MSDTEYTYYWARHPRDGSLFIICESDGLWFMCAIGKPIEFDHANIICRVDPPARVTEGMN